MIVYSSEVTCWSDGLVVADKQNCTKVVEWLQSFKCYGTTATMQALDVRAPTDEILFPYFLNR